MRMECSFTLVFGTNGRHLTTANHHHRGRRPQKQPPSAPQEAFNLAPTSLIDRGQSPEQADTLCSGDERVYSPWNALMERC
jgi:hypothetical protein